MTSKRNNRKTNSYQGTTTFSGTTVSRMTLFRMKFSKLNEMVCECVPILYVQY